MKSLILKVGLACGFLVLFGYLFTWSLEDVNEDPYYVRSADLQQWTIEVDEVRDLNDPVLSLRPPTELPLSLFDQVFMKTMESYTTPSEPGIPLILRRELSEGQQLIPTSVLLEMAHASGLDSLKMTPACMAVYRTHNGREQRRFFVLFKSPSFERFRSDIFERLHASDIATTFDPGALAPALLIASSDPGRLLELPTHGVLKQSCQNDGVRVESKE